MTFNWATVTGVSPLRIRVDGDSSELPFTPDSLVDPEALSVGYRVRVEMAGNRVVVHGISAGLPDPYLSAFARANRVRNGDFRVNQRDSSSSQSIATGAYLLDGWYCLAGTTTIGWSGSDDTGRTITISSSLADLRGLGQKIERRDMPAGDYILAWGGTAVGRIYKEGTTAPAWSSSPIHYVSDGAANVVIELSNQGVGSGSTISDVRLTPGTTPHPYIPRLYAEELAICQRYFVRWASSATGLPLAFGMGDNGGNTVFNLVAPVPLRSTPTAAWSGTWRATLLGASDIAISGFTVLGMADNVMQMLATHATASPGSLRYINSSAAWSFELSAEL